MDKDELRNRNSHSYGYILLKQRNADQSQVGKHIRQNLENVDFRGSPSSELLVAHFFLNNICEVPRNMHLRLKA